MATMHLSIRDDLRAWAEAQVGEGRYASADELVNELLEWQRDQEAKRAWLNAELAKGFASGIDPRSVEDVFANLRERHGLTDG